jgi:hypothetical protein
MPQSTCYAEVDHTLALPPVANPDPFDPANVWVVRYLVVTRDSRGGNVRSSIQPGNNRWPQSTTWGAGLPPGVPESGITPHFLVVTP